jgi:16S rRNA C967 or C1407 C5-methylase (RsmB/RsmF family)
MAAFIETRSDFRLVDLRASASRLLAPFIDQHGYFRTTPPAHGLEAFFAALLTRS